MKTTTQLVTLLMIVSMVAVPAVAAQSSSTCTQAQKDDKNNPECHIQGGFEKMYNAITKWLTILAAIALVFSGFGFIISAGNERARAAARGVATGAAIGLIVGLSGLAFATTIQSWFA
jgi:hypothetical protein